MTLKINLLPSSLLLVLIDNVSVKHTSNSIVCHYKFFEIVKHIFVLLEDKFVLNLKSILLFVQLNSVFLQLLSDVSLHLTVSQGCRQLTVCLLECICHIVQLSFFFFNLNRKSFDLRVQFEALVISKINVSLQFFVFLSDVVDFNHVMFYLLIQRF